MSEIIEQELPEFIPIVPPPVEFRLYYDENGKVITYTCEKLEGNYILIDAQTFAEARQDVSVIDGKVVRVSNNVTIPKLTIGSSGTNTLKEDISIVVDEQSDKTQMWELKNYELK
jgi:hypothetical protein